MKKSFLCLICILASLAFIFCFLPSCEEQTHDLEVHFLSVGEADSILIKTKTKALLIDAGLEENYTTISSALSREGIDRLDYMILTHFDKDHIGSAEELLHTREVGEILMPVYHPTGGTYMKFSAYMESYDGKVTNVTQETTLTLDEFEIKIDPTHLTSIPEDDNNNSLIVSLRHGDFDMLLLGDAEKTRIIEYAARDTAAYDVVKLPHHGDYFKDLKWYLEKNPPTYAISSCEAENVKDNLTEMCSELKIKHYVTGDGTVHLTYDIKSAKLHLEQK